MHKGENEGIGNTKVIIFLKLRTQRHYKCSRFIHKCKNEDIGNVIVIICVNVRNNMLEIC